MSGHPEQDAPDREIGDPVDPRSYAAFDDTADHGVLEVGYGGAGVDAQEGLAGSGASAGGQINNGGAAGSSGKIAAEDEPMPPEMARHVRLLKVIYFVMAFSGSTWGRFSTVYYMGKDLSATQIGILEGCIPAVQLVALPLWGILADKIRSRKRVALTTSVLSSAVLMLLAFPQLAHGFARILAITLATSAFSSSGVLDAHTLEVLGKRHHGRYGQVRMWSSISWGLGAVAMGAINDAVGFTANFGIYAALSLANVVALALVIPERTAVERATRAGDLRLRDLGAALARPRMLFFLLQVRPSLACVRESGCACSCGTARCYPLTRASLPLPLLSTLPPPLPARRSRSSARACPSWSSSCSSTCATTWAPRPPSAGLPSSSPCSSSSRSSTTRATCSAAWATTGCWPRP